jgi:hypothetical protein
MFRRTVIVEQELDLEAVFDLAVSMGLQDHSREIASLVSLIQRMVIEEGTVLNYPLVSSIVESSIAASEHNELDDDLADLRMLVSSTTLQERLRKGVPQLAGYIRSVVGGRSFVEAESADEAEAMGGHPAPTAYVDSEWEAHRLTCLTRAISIPSLFVVITLAVAFVAAVVFVVEPQLQAMPQDKRIQGTLLATVLLLVMLVTCTPPNLVVCSGRLMTRPSDGSMPQRVGFCGLTCRLLGNLLFVAGLDDCTACSNRLSVCDLVCGQQVVDGIPE